jgi:hypothetical protein
MAKRIRRRSAHRLVLVALFLFAALLVSAVGIVLREFFRPVPEPRVAQGFASVRSEEILDRVQTSDGETSVHAETKPVLECDFENSEGELRQVLIHLGAIEAPEGADAEMRLMVDEWNNSVETFVAQFLKSRIEASSQPFEECFKNVGKSYFEYTNIRETLDKRILDEIRRSQTGLVAPGQWAVEKVILFRMEAEIAARCGDFGTAAFTYELLEDWDGEVYCYRKLGGYRELYRLAVRSLERASLRIERHIGQLIY